MAKKKPKNKRIRKTPHKNTLKKTTQKNYAVAFLDVLGYSAYLKESTNEQSNDYYLKITSAIDEVLNLEGYKSPFTPKSNFVKDSKLLIRVFSDNILLAVKQTGNLDKDVDNYQNLLYLILCLQLRFLTEYDLLLRGGITIGKFIYNESLVFGKALVHAVELEKTANFPRVLIQKRDIESFYNKKKLDKRVITNFLMLVCKDGEDYFTNSFISVYINISKFGFMEVSQDTYGATKPCPLSVPIIQKARDSLTRIVKRDGTNAETKILAKLEWILLYFNYSCKVNDELNHLIINFEISSNNEKEEKSILLIEDEQSLL